MTHNYIPALRTAARWFATSVHIPAIALQCRYLDCANRSPGLALGVSSVKPSARELTLSTLTILRSKEDLYIRIRIPCAPEWSTTPTPIRSTWIIITIDHRNPSKVNLLTLECASRIRSTTHCSTPSRIAAPSTIGTFIGSHINSPCFPQRNPSDPIARAPIAASWHLAPGNIPGQYCYREHATQA